MSAPIHAAPSEGLRPSEMVRAFLQEVWSVPWPGYLMICSGPPGNDKDAPLSSRSFAARSKFISFDASIISRSICPRTFFLSPSKNRISR